MTVKTLQEEFTVSTNKEIELVDITDKVEGIAKSSKIKRGICMVFVPHATAAVMLNEAESGLMKDIESYIKKNFPPAAGYMHDRIDDNAHSHIASAIIGQSKSIPIKDSKLVRGTWQQIFVVELDGPRNRRHVVITVFGE